MRLNRSLKTSHYRVVIMEGIGPTIAARGPRTGSATKRLAAGAVWSSPPCTGRTVPREGPGRTPDFHSPQLRSRRQTPTASACRVRLMAIATSSSSGARRADGLGSHHRGARARALLGSGGGQPKMSNSEESTIAVRRRQAADRLAGRPRLWRPHRVRLLRHSPAPKHVARCGLRQ
jgi:hypothetical protein